MNTNIPTWLTKYQTNGVDLSLHELMFYRGLSSLLNLSPSRDIAGALSGGERPKIKGRGMEFDEARHYQPGDDIRSIDWRVTARTGKTHTKVFREERERPVFVFTDFSQSMYFGTTFLCKSVQAAHLSSLITWNAIQRGDKVGGLIFNNDSDMELKPKAQMKSALKFMQALVDTHSPTFKVTQVDSERIFDSAIARLRHIAKPGALVYLISDFNALSPSAMATIGQINRYCEVKAMLVNDPMETTLPESNSKQKLSITNGIKRQLVNLGETKTNIDYASKQAKHLGAIKDAFDKYAIPLRVVSAGMPLELQLTNRDMGEAL
ncbi:DUF58 domain-containing protein [Glaciecola sp. MH2013]|uniref:DUF58 domain-containing protein n=1 Tax=Glaciecola sp. MH2013 TaxID=2785524 RepID=UPI00189DAB87|nr:DUF58 domain-containing protein [Glaciecola sp. MH2013]MBF7073267.1 DUF58 domain-containing protein [Glaciecola sp. MH2013]